MDELSESLMIKLMGLDTYDTLTMKIKYERNNVFSEVINDSTRVIVLNPTTAVVSFNKE